ncbi:MAG: LysE family translocator [Rhodospirillaceae bacterium]|nr:LysE family translocator [Rhodospirillaceae bacterium]
METLGTFILAALALTGSPGPNTLSMAGVGAAFGRRRGFRYMVGLNIGMAAVITVVGTGVSGLLFAVPGAAPVISVMAGAYFVVLAYRIATAPALTDTGAPGSEPKWYEGTFLSLVNPKAYAAMAALFSGFVLIDDDPAADGILKAALLMAMIIFVNVCWLYAGSLLTRVMRHERAHRAINLTFAGLLIASVAVAIML